MDQQPLSPQQPINPEPVSPPIPQPIAPRPTPSYGNLPTSPISSTNSTETVGVPGGVINPSGEMGVGTAPNTVIGSKKPRNKLKAVLLVLVGMAVLGGGSAAAYFGVVVPNKPENVLKAAMFNTLEQNSSTINVLAEGKSGGAGYKAEMTLMGNAEDKSSSMDAKVTVTGFTFTGEARMVGGSAFVKMGDLSNITNLVEGYAPEYAEIANTVADEVSNQWYEIDSTILKTAGADCLLETESKLTDADLEVIAKAYSEKPFVTINNTSNLDLNGKSAIQYDLTINSKKAAEFMASLENTSFFKNVESCATETQQATGTGDQDISDTIKTDDIKDTDKVDLTLWVDKSTKLISKIAFQASEDMKKDGNDGKVELSMDYAPVKVDKPEDPKPISDMIAELGKAFNGQPVLGAQIENLLP